MSRISRFVAACACALALSLARAPSVQAQPMERTGLLDIRNDQERELFGQLKCMCGTCAREMLSTCTCGYAAERREELRAELAKGRSIEDIKADYVREYGTDALAVPPNTGSNRLVYMLPLGAIVLGAVAVVGFLSRLRRNAPPPPPKPPTKTDKASKGGKVAKKARDDYDDKLDAELRALDDE